MVVPDTREAIAQRPFQDSPAAIFRLDARGACVAANRAFVLMTGVREIDALGNGWLQILPEVHRADAAKEIEGLVRDGVRFQREFPRDVAGSLRWLLCSVSPQADAAGAIYSFAGWVYDISERKRVELEREELTEQLRASEEMHRLVRRVGKFAHWTLKPGETRPTWSREMFALWGRNPEDGAPTSEELFARGDPAERARLQESAARLFAGEPSEVEYRVTGWDGVLRWIHARREALFDANGAVSMVVGIAQDVTWRHEALRDRAQSDRFLSGLTMALPDPSFVHDGERILFGNPAFAALLGWDNENELVGQPLLSVFPTNEHQRKMARARRALSGAANPSVELSLLRRDGSACPAEISSIAAEYEAKPAVLEMVRDLSARRAAEEQRLVSDRAAALATLASGVAHEVNNPLAFLQSNVEMIVDQLAAMNPDEPARLGKEELAELLTMAREAREGSQRVKAIVRDLQTFAGRGHSELLPQDPTDALELALRLVDHELRGRCRVIKRYQPAPLVRVDRAQLAQAFINLLTNAAQAMAGGDPNKSQLRISVGTAPDGTARIELEDTGPGIAAENLPRVFEPFFTTKPVGSGTGLGLSVALNSVKAMGGTISARSQPGHGAVFRVTLPPSRLEEKQERAPVSEALPRVLVVDDDPLIGQSLRRLLGRECDVVLATTTAGALEEVDKNRAFSLLLVDLAMAGSDGIELYEALATRAPELSSLVIFMSGGAISKRERQFLDGGSQPLLEKPFQAARVRALVRDAIRAAVARKQPG